MLDLARQMGQHDINKISDQVTNLFYLSELFLFLKKART